jgi:hypothetical protein
MPNDDDVDIQLRMTQKQAREFTERLNDQEFRRQLRESPKETLSKYGIEISETLASGTIVLPEMYRNLDSLSGAIPGGTGFRTEADTTCIHVILWFASALASSDY